MSAIGQKRTFLDGKTAESAVGLRVFGDDLIPSEISALMGVSPSRAHQKGERFKSGDRMLERRSGSWHFKVPSAKPEDFDGQVRELLMQLPQDLSVWRELCQRFDVDLFCGWFMDESNEGLTVAPETLAALGSRGIVLSLDIYGPTVDSTTQPVTSSDEAGR